VAVLPVLFQALTAGRLTPCLRQPWPPETDRALAGCGPMAGSRHWAMSKPYLR